MAIQSGGFARIATFKEILFVVAVDNGEAWLKDDFGNRMTRKVVDLERVPYTEGVAYFAACERVSGVTELRAELNAEVAYSKATGLGDHAKINRLAGAIAAFAISGVTERLVA